MTWINLAAAIGHALIEQGLRVRHYPASTRVQELQTAKHALRLPDALTKLDKYALLITEVDGPAVIPEGLLREALAIGDGLAQAFRLGPAVVRPGLRRATVESQSPR